MGIIIEKAFLTDVQRSNREKVRNSRAQTPDPLDTIIGYEFEENGHYSTYYFHDIKEVVQFIRESTKDKLLCNNDDYAVACTIGDYVDLCVSEEYRDMLVNTEVYS